ncbi:hypothetical protein [Mangrovibacterium sp.]|uniref:hypothetical protein n=1 Tax=Mangrovibacterium sp. TaxID=1961364 RepID=UPI003564CE9A
MTRYYFYTALILVVLACSANRHGVLAPGTDPGGTIHRVGLSDPAHFLEEPVVYDLVERKSPNGLPSEFFLDVPSVYCDDSVCKIVPVRIFWNPIGEYQRFELEKRNKLEKNKGKPFSKKDCQKLDRILQDKTSPFGGISLSEITKTSSSEGVDAISGATTIVLDDNATVRGATLTCYTLWRWGNGDVCDSIRRISGDALSPVILRSYLDAEDNLKLYAIDQISRRRLFDPETVASVVRSSCSDMREWSGYQIRYLEQAPDSVYFSMLRLLVSTDDEFQKVASLNSLLKTKKLAPAGYFDQIGELLPGLDSYQVVDLFLRLMEQKNAGSELINEKLILLLDRSILISRRAYWFLNNQKLSAEQEAVLRKYRTANAEYF